MQLTREKAYEQYLYEVACFERWGNTNTTTFEEWLKIKGITIKEDAK